jgi:hypothetical protein
MQRIRCKRKCRIFIQTPTDFLESAVAQVPLEFDRSYLIQYGEFPLDMEITAQTTSPKSGFNHFSANHAAVL